MIIKQEPKFKIEFNETEHKYKVDGKETISVSEFLKFIDQGYGNVPQNILKQAQERGKLAHKTLEDEIMGFNTKNNFSAIIKQLVSENFQTDDIETELQVTNGQIAGTLDLRVADTIYDLKTTRAKSKKHFIQAYIYAELFKSYFNLPNLELNIGIIYLSENNYSIHKVSNKQLTPLRDLYLYLLALNTNIKATEVSQEVLDKLLDAFEIPQPTTQSQGKQIETKDELAESFIRLEYIKNEIKLIENETYKALKESEELEKQNIRNYMEKENEKKIVIGKFSASFTTSERFNSTKFKTDQPDIYKDYVTTSTTFTIRELKN